MLSMKLFLLLSNFMFQHCFIEAAIFSGGSTFIAAVYEHAIIIPPNRSDVITREQALDNMNRNLDILEEKAKLVQDAHMLVFPEDGIYSFGFKSPDTIHPYMEHIPQVEKGKSTWCPCDFNYSNNSIQVQKRLSCMAKENQLYLVANMGDKQPCLNKEDPKCLPSGDKIYNTNVVFNDKGCLVSKYHKQNLYLAEPFNTPEEVNYAYFDTPFGRFGTFTCFDILFRDPAVKLVEDFQIDHIAFPTAWMSVFPHFVSIGTHSSFARMMNVNLLAANIHLPNKRMVGSGIYTPQGFANVTYEPDTPAGQMAKATIKRKPTPNVPYKPNTHRSSMCPEKDIETFESPLHRDVYSWVALDKRAPGKLCVCQKRVCCHLDFSISPASVDTSDLYALGAFDGLHVSRSSQYYIQTCALVKCANQSRRSCGSSTKIAHTTFSRVHLRGEFDIKYILPEVLGAPVGIDVGSWSYGNGTITTNGMMKKPLLSAILYGRWYDKDDGKVNGAPFGHREYFIWQFALALLLSIAQRLC